jgi:hypothetical protein
MLRQIKLTLSRLPAPVAERIVYENMVDGRWKVCLVRVFFVGVQDGTDRLAAHGLYMRIHGPKPHVALNLICWLRNYRHSLKASKHAP